MLENDDKRFFCRIMLGIGGQFMQQLRGINLCWISGSFTPHPYVFKTCLYSGF